MKKKKKHADWEIGYFRSRDLSICSLFNLDKHDAALLLAHLEAVDEEFSGKVNIVKFSKRYFPEQKFVFQYLWKYFIVIYKDSRLGLGSSSYADNVARSTGEVQDKEHGTYVEVLSFLFFIVSIKKNHFTHFLYWLVYEVGEEKKTRKGLVSMVDTMWTLEKAYFEKEKAKKREMYLPMVKAAVKHLEASALDIKTFQIYDFRVQNAFSVPIKSLQKEILKRFATRVFWKKCSKEIVIILEQPGVVVPRMGEKNSNKSPGKVSHRSIGDRKYAWFEIRDYIEAFFRFHELANGVVIEPTTIIGKILSFFRRSNKISRITPVDLDNPNADANEYSLKQRVDIRKQWPIDKYYDEAETNRSLALRKLEQCDEELNDPLPNNFEEEAQKTKGNQDDSSEYGDSDRFIDDQYSNDSD